MERPAHRAGSRKNVQAGRNRTSTVWRCRSGTPSCSGCWRFFTAGGLSAERLRRPGRRRGIGGSRYHGRRDWGSRRRRRSGGRRRRRRRDGGTATAGAGAGAAALRDRDRGHRHQRHRGRRVSTGGGGAQPAGRRRRRRGHDRARRQRRNGDDCGAGGPDRPAARRARRRRRPAAAASPARRGVAARAAVAGAGLPRHAPAPQSALRLSLASAVSYQSNANPSAIAAGDVTGDGKPDLAVANFNKPGTVTVLVNKGNGTFAAPVGYTLGREHLRGGDRRSERRRPRRHRRQPQQPGRRVNVSATTARAPSPPPSATRPAPTTTASPPAT